MKLSQLKLFYSNNTEAPVYALPIFKSVKRPWASEHYTTHDPEHTSFILTENNCRSLLLKFYSILLTMHNLVTTYTISLTDQCLWDALSILLMISRYWNVWPTWYLTLLYSSRFLRAFSISQTLCLSDINTTFPSRVIFIKGYLYENEFFQLSILKHIQQSSNLYEKHKVPSVAAQKEKRWGRINITTILTKAKIYLNSHPRGWQKHEKEQKAKNPLLTNLQETHSLTLPPQSKNHLSHPQPRCPVSHRASRASIAVGSSLLPSLPFWKSWCPHLCNPNNVTLYSCIRIHNSSCLFSVLHATWGRCQAHAALPGEVKEPVPLCLSHYRL